MENSHAWRSAEAVKATYYVMSPDPQVIELRAPKSPLGIERDGGHGTALAAMWDSAETWMRPRFDDIQAPAARLELGLNRETDLRYGHKLHLYARALADRFKAVKGVQLTSVKLTKSCSDSTNLAIGTAIPTRHPKDATATRLVTRYSYARPEFVNAIHESTQNIRDIATESTTLRLNVSFVTGFPRTWSRLWRPTIEGIFGDSARQQCKLDSSQVVELSLSHTSVGERIRHLVVINVSASTV